MLLVSRTQSISLMLALLWVWLAAAPFVHAQTPSAIASTKEQVRLLHAKSARVQITVQPGTRLRGKIVQVADETFVLRLDSAQEQTLEYARVIEIRKKGISKWVLVPAVVGGAAFLVLCAAPYPVGFLCHRDPS